MKTKRGKRCKNCMGAGFHVRLTGTHIEAEGCVDCGGKPPTAEQLDALIRLLLARAGKRKP